MSEPTQLTDRALERRVKRWLRSAPFDCFIQAAPGLEQTLQRELEGHGFEVQATAPGGVALQLDAPMIMKANLVLRTASRVLLRLGNFPAGSREMLYDRARRLPWELYLGRTGSYSLHMVAKASKLQAGDELAVIMKDAIHRYTQELGITAKHDQDSPLEIHVRLLNDHATLSLNTSGEHLHRRGFRRYVGEAPIRETVAAALALSAWDGHDLVVDPFCGSGTLLLEMADLVTGALPGRARSFAFEEAGWFRAGLWREVQRQSQAAAEEATPGEVPRLLGFDVDTAVLEAAGRNLKAAGHEQVELQKGDATRLDYSALPGERRLLIGNLPFGKRLGDPASARRLLERFLTRLAHGGSWDLALITTQPQLLRAADALEILDEQVVASGGLRISLVRARLRQ